tara:strand:+ start:550 stop:4194 length:3645 start_codon:yes stop_codon:yes gene_type:complete
MSMTTEELLSRIPTTEPENNIETKKTVKGFSTEQLLGIPEKPRSASEQTTGETLAEVGLEITGSIAAQTAATLTGPLYPVTAFAGGFTASVAAQRSIGSSDVSYGRAIINGLVTILPLAPALKGVHSTSKITGKIIGDVAKTEAKRGSAIGAGYVTSDAIENEGRAPTLGEFATGVALGSAFGGTTGSLMPKISKTFQKVWGKTPVQIEKALGDGSITKAEAIKMAMVGNRSNNPVAIKEATKIVEDAVESISRKGITKALGADDVSFSANGAVKSVAAGFTNAKAMLVPSRILGPETTKEIYAVSKRLEGILDIGEKIGTNVDDYLIKHPAKTESVQLALKSGKFADDIKGTPVEGDIIKYRQQIEELQTIGARHLSEEDFINMTRDKQGELLGMLNKSISSTEKYNTIEYQMFTNSKFKPDPKQLPLARKEVTLRILKEDPSKSKKLAAQEAKEHLEKLTAQSARNLKNSNRFVASVEGIFKRRGDVGPEEAKYLGVITAPGETMKGTINRLGRYVLLNEGDVSITKHIIKTGQGAINPINKKGLVPLELKGNINNEVWVTPEYNLAISKGYLSIADAASKNPAIAGIVNGYTGAVALSKAVKVVFNLPSHAVNLWGATAQMIGMGMNPISRGVLKGAKAGLSEFRVFEKLFSGKTAQSRLAFLKEMQEWKTMGLMGKNVVVSDIRDGIKQGWVGDKLGKFIDPAGKAYSISDTAARIGVYKHNNTAFEKIFPSQLDKIKVGAAKYTNDTYQNYERISPVVRAFSRLGIMPQFVAFTAEFTRNMANQARTASQMLKGTFGKEYGFDVSQANMKAMRIEGAKRLTGLLTLTAAAIVAVRKNNDTSGVTSEKEKAMRVFHAEYNKDKALIYSDMSEDGKEGKFMDAQYLIPHVGVGSIVKSIFSEEPVKNVWKQFSKAFIGDGTFVLVNTIQGLQNKDEYGNQISGDPSSLNQFVDRFSYVIEETFTPGQARELSKLMETKASIAQGKKPRYTHLELALRNLGLRNTPFKVADMAMFKTKSFNKAAIDAGREYRGARDYKDTPKNVLDDLYNEANRIRKANMDEVVKVNQALITLEFNEEERIQVLKDAGLSSKDVLSVLDGSYIPLDREKSTSTSEIFEDKYADMPVKQFKKELNLIAKDDIRLATRLRDEYKRRLKDNYRGLTSTDKLFSSMAVEDRVNYIIKNPGLYKEYKKKGLINKSIYIELRRKGYQF